MDLKKWILPVIIVVLIGGYLIYRQFSAAPAAQAPITTNNNQSSGQNQATNQNAQTNSGQSTPPPTQTGYKDGQYTGTTASTVYGDVQVQVTISGGKITDIEVPTYPTGAGHTIQLSDSSLPVLKSEAIATQSANVNVVSGATQTSQGFMQSLASALSQAS